MTPRRQLALMRRYIAAELKYLKHQIRKYDVLRSMVLNTGGKVETYEYQFRCRGRALFLRQLLNGDVAQLDKHVADRERRMAWFPVYCDTLKGRTVGWRAVSRK